jgi:2-phosphosulfolactate phosphatase
VSEPPAYLLQSDAAVCCECGPNAVAALAPGCDVVIVVDVLSFSTCVDVATARGAIVFPYRFRDASAAGFASSVGGELAGENPRGYSLRPASLTEIESGTRLVLPSPNGSTLSLGAGRAVTVAGCLRNRSAVARYAASIAASGRILVVAAGEKWRDGSLRPAFEDFCGAGAIIDALPESLSRSLEARAAQEVFRQSRDELTRSIEDCASGREKFARDQAEDVALAAALDVSDCVPVLNDGAYCASSERLSIRSR